MFLGHFGVAFAAKRAAPKTSLGTLLLAAQFADMLWPVLLLSGVEQLQIIHGATPLLNLQFTDYRYSHSLATQIGLGVLLACVYFLITGYRRGALVVAVLVPSHWVLDWFVHVPDLPLFPGGAVKYGLGIWTSLTLTLACEFAVLGAGLALYLNATRARDRIGRWSLGAFVTFLLLLYAGSLLAGPPPSAQVVAWSALALWLEPLWAHSFDRHRALAAGGA